MKKATLGEGDDIGSRPAYTIVYVSEGESLWSIAKKYSADPAEIAAANGLRASAVAAPESLSGVDFLII